MSDRKTAVAQVVKKAYLRILPLQIFGIVISAINTFIDSLVTSRFLGTDAMAAIGLFGPIGTVIGISYVLITGTQILCSQSLGEGDEKKVIGTFSTTAALVSAFGLAFTLICIAFRKSLVVLVGASSITSDLLSDYILGYSFGITGQMLFGMMTAFLPVNNQMKRSYVGIAVMIVSNVACDLIFTIGIRMGIFGMALPARSAI